MIVKPSATFVEKLLDRETEVSETARKLVFELVEKLLPRETEVCRSARKLLFESA